MPAPASQAGQHVAPAAGLTRHPLPALRRAPAPGYAAPAPASYAGPAPAYSGGAAAAAYVASPAAGAGLCRRPLAWPGSARPGQTMPADRLRAPGPIPGPCADAAAARPRVRRSLHLPGSRPRDGRADLRRAAPAAQGRRRGDADRPADVRRGGELRGGPGRLDHPGRAELRLDPAGRPVGKTSATARPCAAPASGSAWRWCPARRCSATWSPSRSPTCPTADPPGRQGRQPGPERLLLRSHLQRVAGAAQRRAASVWATSSRTT